MISGGQKVVSDLEGYVRNMGRHAEDFGRELKSSVRRAIQFTGAIDTTLMVNAIDYTRGFVTDSGTSLFVGAVGNPDVFYDGFVEFDTHNRDGTLRPGRFFYQRGIETAEFEQIFNEVAQESFVI